MASKTVYSCDICGNEFKYKQVPYGDFILETVIIRHGDLTSDTVKYEDVCNECISELEVYIEKWHASRNGIAI